MKKTYKTVTITDGAVDQNVELGFTPDYVKIFDPATTNSAELVAIEGTVKDAWSVVGSTGARTDETSNLTLYAGATGTAAKGITIGSSFALAVTANVLVIIAETYEIEAGGAAVSTSVL